MHGLDPRIRLKKLFLPNGLHRTSGQPEVRTLLQCRKSGIPDLRVKPGNDARL